MFTNRAGWIVVVFAAVGIASGCAGKRAGDEDLAAKLEAATTQRAADEATIAELEKRLAEVQKKAADADKNAADLTRRLADVEKRVAEAEKKAVDAEREKTRLAGEVASLKPKADKAVEIEKLLTAARSEAAAATGQIKDMQRDHAALSTENAGLQDKIKALEEQIEELKRQLAAKAPAAGGVRDAMP